MYEVSQNVDLSLKVDALSKKFDQLLALNILPTNSPNVQGQLANAISRRDEGKLPSHPIENPRANYHEQAKAIITIRNEKLVDNKVGEPIKDSESNNNETKRISMTKIERKIEKELASSSNFKTLESSPTTSYKPNVPYPEALLPPPHLRKDNKREDILETLKQVKINLPLLEVIKQVPSYAKFLKDVYF
ncbi:hypothetical protein M9H77_07391 [Catharanthus roseus]|uniref:Uncharacterized protein n=1 Tax=Catharanthus roseus TaxID=4058 RepID=A0ACC0BUU7_CATRO|nr:hypothetical protein M9H77_07391 [Catharanthus roseus]